MGQWEVWSRKTNVCHEKILVENGKFELEKADFLTKSIKEHR